MKPILLGRTVDGDRPVNLDVAKLVESRMLLQASSGYGKSHAIRRILEQSFGQVQHLVLDWEGEFYTLREKFDYALVSFAKEADGKPELRSAGKLAVTLLETGASCIVDLSELPLHDRHRYARLFLEALLDAPKDLRHACLVVVDEAHSFCPEKSSAESGPWVGTLMAAGRKRGLAGILATQRLAKLDKDAAAEAHVKLVGKATLDDDVKRSADELGWGKKDHGRIRFLKRGQFFAYGPGLSDEVVLVMVGDTETRSPRFGAKPSPVPPTPAKVRTILGERLALLPQEAAAEAKTVDELRAVVASQKRELAKLAAAKPAEPAPAKVQTKEVEKPVLTKRQSDDLHAVVRETRTLAEKASWLSERSALLFDKATRLDMEVRGALQSRATAAPAPASAAPPRPRPVPAVVPARPQRVVEAPSDGLAPTQQRILDVVAMLGVRGIPASRECVARWQGIHPNGSRYLGDLARLRERGDLEGFALTASGQAAARPLDTGLDAVYAALEEETTRKLLKVVAEADRPLSREEVAAELGIHPNGSRFLGDLAWLRTMGVIPERAPILLTEGARR